MANQEEKKKLAKVLSTITEGYVGNLVKPFVEGVITDRVLKVLADNVENILDIETVSVDEADGSVVFKVRVRRP